MSNKTYSFKKVIVVFLSMSIVSGIAYRVWRAHTPTIYTFNKVHDMQPVLAIFQQNWHMLFFGSNYSPEFILTYLAPSHDPQYLGKLNVDVLKKGSDVMGFVAYYMKSKELGFLLFLAVDSKFRRQHHGERLLKHGLRRLACMGAKKIQILTRLSNIPARTLYEHIGFHEISRNESGDAIYFEYDTVEK